MIKVFIAMSLLLAFSGLSYAQPDTSMRTMAADQLFEHGQALYERGQKAEAVQVFHRVIALQPNHPGASKYLKKASKSIKTSPDTNTAISPIIAPVIKHTNEFAQSANFKDLNQGFESKTNAELQKEIQAADQMIIALQKDIVDLESQLTHQEKDNPKSINETTSSN